jgi:HD-GYP domain-containing protein (c-di-GMP phosphodiesterase class II)
VLRKPGRLDPREPTIVEPHAELGYNMLAGSYDPTLTLALTITSL